jgi:hypothetical protein
MVMDFIQKLIEEKQRLMAVMCDADKRNNMLLFWSEDDMQFLSPTIEDFEKYFEEESKEVNYLV